MKILDSRGVILTVFENFSHWRDKGRTLSPDDVALLDALDALDPKTVTWSELQAVAPISDNLCDCDECGAQNVPTVLFCENANIEEHMAYICAECLEKALKALREAKK